MGRCDCLKPSPGDAVCLGPSHQEAQSRKVATADATYAGIGILASLGPILQEAGAQPNSFYERSARSLLSMGGKLASWNAMRDHTDVMQKLQKRVDGMCAKLDAGDPQRATCEGLLKPDYRASKAASSS